MIALALPFRRADVEIACSRCAATGQRVPRGTLAQAPDGSWRAREWALPQGWRRYPQILCQGCAARVQTWIERRP